MGKAKALSKKLQEQIVKEVKKGYSQRAVADTFGVSKSGVGYVMARYNQRGCVEIRKSPGRPLISTDREDRALVNRSKEEPRLNAVQLHAEMDKNYGLKYSVSTVKRRLNKAGLFGRRPAKKPLISVKNRIARVKFAKDHQNWTSADWSKVLWSDESKYLLFGTDGINYIRRGKNQRYDPKHQLPTVKHGGGSIMVWGSFSRDGLGPIHRIEGIMDQVVYKNIMSDVMLPHAKHAMVRGWLFQQDNDPKHTAKSVQEFFRAKKIRILDWPSQSPDLNPIEHLWAHLERQLTGRKPTNKNDLFAQLKEAWNNIELDVLIKLVDSMPNRCQEVIKAKGYATRY